MTSLVSHSSASTISSSQGMKASPKEVPFIDLSYRTHLDTSNLQSILSKGIHGVKSIREVSSADSKDQDSDATISIDRFNMDVSASRLGDAGILSLLDSLVEYEERNVSSDLVISLEARMNHISIVGASNLFERISGWKSVQTHFLEGDEKSDEMDSPDKNVVGLESFGNEIENGDENDKEETNMDAKDQGEESDVSSVSRNQRNVYIEALDIGLNDIGHCHIITAHKKAATAMSQLNKSLRTLIENESGSCPRVLRMDVCGFGAPSCRAIGKVSFKTAASPMQMYCVLLGSLLGAFCIDTFPSRLAAIKPNFSPAHFFADSWAPPGADSPSKSYYITKTTTSNPAEIISQWK